jgi:hypothetical protein
MSGLVCLVTWASHSSAALCGFNHLNSMTPNKGLVKVRVRLVGSASRSGYESETLWAEPLGANRYRIWNLPVFVYEVW